MLPLSSHLIELDRQESKKKHYNLHALAQYMQAAQEYDRLISNDRMSREGAFIEVFAPTRAIVKIAKTMGLQLSVEKGRWVVNIA